MKIYIKTKVLKTILKSGSGKYYKNWEQQIFGSVGRPDLLDHVCIRNVRSFKNMIKKHTKRENIEKFVIGTLEDWNLQLELFSNLPPIELDNDGFIIPLTNNLRQETINLDDIDNVETPEIQNIDINETEVLEFEKTLEDQSEQMNQTQEYQVVTVVETSEDQIQMMDFIAELKADQEKLVIKIKKLQHQVNILRKLNSEKSSRLKYRMKHPLKPLKMNIIRTKTNNRDYDYKFRELVVALSIYGVADEKINSVLNLMCKFFNKKFSSLPDARTVARWVLNLHVYVNQQIFEFIQNQPNLTLNSDETTLLGNKLQAYLATKFNESTNKIEKIFLGLKQVPDKRAQTSLATFQTVISEIVSSSNEVDDEELELLSEKLILNFKTCMGDRASTQTCFNGLLNVLKEEISGTEQTTNTVPCLLHIIATAFDALEKPLLEQECQLFNKDLSKSTVFETIKFVSSVFGDRSFAVKSWHESWNQFAEEHQLQFYKFAGKYGKRWNIGLVNAAILYFHRILMLEFVKMHIDEEPQFKQIIEVLTFPVLLTQLQGLAFIELIVIGPFWTAIETGDNVLDCIKVAKKLIEYLDRCVIDPWHANKFPPPELPDSKEKQNLFLAEMLNSNNELLARNAPQLFKSMTSYFKKELRSFLLPLSDKIANELKSALGSNKISEQIFAIADMVKKKSPNMSLERCEIVVKALSNDVFEWFNSLPDTKKNKIRNMTQSQGQHRLLKITEERKRIKTAIRSRKMLKKPKKSKRSLVPIQNEYSFVGKEFQILLRDDYYFGQFMRIVATVDDKFIIEIGNRKNIRIETKKVLDYYDKKYLFEVLM